MEFLISDHCEPVRGKRVNVTSSSWKRVECQMYSFEKKITLHTKHSTYYILQQPYIVGHRNGRVQRNLGLWGDDDTE